MIRILILSAVLAFCPFYWDCNVQPGEPWPGPGDPYDPNEYDE